MTVALVSTWDSLRDWWESSYYIQPHTYSLDELSTGRLGYKSYIHARSFISADFEGLVIHQSIPSLPVNRSSKLWSCRKVTQVEDQIIFGQPHGITLLWMTYSAVGRNKLVQISKLDLMGHRDRSLSHGTSHCHCCFITYAEVCVFVKLPLLPFSSSPLPPHA